MNLQAQHDQLHTALKEQYAAENALEEVMSEYQTELAEFERQHQDLIYRRDAAIKRHQAANTAVGQLQSNIETELSKDFVDDLPLGFIQKRSPQVIYEAQGFLRVAVDRFPFLLQLNEETVHEFFTTMATKQVDGSYILPENIRSWASVEIIDLPEPDIVHHLVQLEPIENPETNSPADESVLAQANEVVNNYQIEKILEGETEEILVEELTD